MRRYYGMRALGVPFVFVRIDDGAPQPLSVRTDLKNHSPTFEWGYEGAGPAQLALALLADATGDDTLALSLYQAFKDEHVAKWVTPEFTITDAEIMAWVKVKQA